MSDLMGKVAGSHPIPLLEDDSHGFMKSWRPLWEPKRWPGNAGPGEVEELSRLRHVKFRLSKTNSQFQGVATGQVIAVLESVRAHGKGGHEFLHTTIGVRHGPTSFQGEARAWHMGLRAGGGPASTQNESQFVSIGMIRGPTDTRGRTGAIGHGKPSDRDGAASSPSERGPV